MNRSEKFLPRAAVLLFVALAVSGQRRIFADTSSAAPMIDKDSALILQSAIVLGVKPERSADSITPYSNALRSSLALAFRQSGFKVKLSEESFQPRASEASEAAAMASSAGCDWVAFSVLSIKGSRLSYRIAIYDAVSDGLVASDSFTAVAGLGVFALIDESTARVVKRAREASRGLDSSQHAINYRVRIASPDEGASVALGSSIGKKAFPLGKIEGESSSFPISPSSQEKKSASPCARRPDERRA